MDVFTKIMLTLLVVSSVGAIFGVGWQRTSWPNTRNAEIFTGVCVIVWVFAALCAAINVIWKA